MYIGKEGNSTSSLCPGTLFQKERSEGMKKEVKKIQLTLFCRKIEKI